MAKLIQRIGQSKFMMSIQIDFVQLESDKIFLDNEFSIHIKRGPEGMDTRKYKFKSHQQTSVQLTDTFKRTSQFR